jgi:hypothetical protein
MFFALSSVPNAGGIDSLRRILSVDYRHIDKCLFQFPSYQTMTSMQLWQGMAHVRIFLVSDKYQE